MVAAQIAKWRLLVACNFAVRKSVFIDLVQKRDLHLISKMGTQSWAWPHLRADISFLLIGVPATKLPVLVIHTHIWNREFFVDHLNNGPQPLFFHAPGDLR